MNNIMQFIIFWSERKHYIGWARKVSPQYSTHKFVKYWPIFKILCNKYPTSPYSCCKNDVTKRRNGNDNNTGNRVYGDSIRLYCEHNTGKILLSTCL